MLRQKENGPFLIHCQHGADRMLEQDWSAQYALTELVDGGYGYHSLWKNIRSYVLSVDVPGLRTKIGGPIEAPPAN